MKKTIIIKRQDVLWFLHSLSHFSEQVWRFSYWIMRNISVLKPYYEEAAKKQQDIMYPDFKVIDNERATIIAKDYADKDEKWNPIIIWSEYQITTKRKAYEKFWSKYREDHKEIYDEQEKINEEFFEYLNEEIEIEIFIIKAETIPDTYSANELLTIEKFLED